MKNKLAIAIIIGFFFQIVLAYTPVEKDKILTKNIHIAIDWIIKKDMDSLMPIEKKLQKIVMNNNLPERDKYLLNNIWMYMFNKLSHVPTLEKYSKNYIKNVVNPRKKEINKQKLGTFTASKWNFAVNGTYIKKEKTNTYINGENKLMKYANKRILTHKWVIYYQNISSIDTPPLTWWKCWLWYNKNLIFTKN